MTREAEKLPLWYGARMMRSSALALALAMGLVACTRPAPEGPAERREPSKGARLTSRPIPQFPASADLLERRGAGRIKYLGFDVSPSPPLAPGTQVELKHYFEAVVASRGDYAVLVDLAIPGDAAAIASDAHRPVSGKAPTHSWKPGEIWVDTHRMRIPASARAAALEVWLALSEGGEKMTVEAPAGASDGKDRLRAATLQVDISKAGPADDGLPVVVIPRRTSTITIDGDLDEAAWARAPTLTFADTMGRDVQLQSPTKLKLLWDDEFLYVGFDSVDRDITDPFVNRDDPIYDHETVEVFIMPQVIAPALGPYVELQASPKGVIFDASFTGRRQGMDKGFDAKQTIATKVIGTLNDPAPDEGWRSEWKVPWKSMRWVTRPPVVGDEWRMNAFRIEKFSGGGEFSAWSPPRVGDFHATDKLGRMRFGP